MYYANQIVHDLVHNRPVSCSDVPIEQLISGTQCYIESDPNAESPLKFRIAFPASIAAAKEALKRHLIVPAPQAHTHCPDCGHWKSNHRWGWLQARCPHRYPDYEDRG